MHSVLFIGKGLITTSLASFLTDNDWHIDYFQRSSADLRKIDLSKYDFVVSCLPDVASAKYIWCELLDSALTCEAHSTEFIEISTLTCEVIADTNDAFRRENFTFTEAPFTGSKSGALSGNLIYFSCSESTPPESNNFLKSTSSRIYTFNDISGPTQFKLFYNLWGLSCLGVMGQMLPLMNSLLQKDLAVEIITSNEDFWMGAIAQQKLPQSLSANYDDIHCKLKYATKDIKYALDEFSDYKLDMSQCLLALLESDRAQAYGDSDFTSMNELFQ